LTEGSASVRFCRAAAAVAALASVLVRLDAQAQPQQQTPVFRSGIDVVPITVTVTDQRGKPVTGLTQKDFRILEDGKAREIVGFYPQTLIAGNAPPPVVNVGRHSNRLEPATRRTFLLVLGRGRIQEPTKALDGAIAFVREHLLPQDAVAVFAFHRMTAFTTDHEAIAQVLTRYKKEHERLWWDIGQYFVRTRTPYTVRQVRLPIEDDLGLPEHGGPPLPVNMLADIDRALFEGVLPKASLRTASDVLLGMDLAAPTGDRSYKRQYVFSELLYWLQGLGLSLSNTVLQSNPLKLFAGIEHLRFLDGDRHLVYVGGAPPMARNADVARLFGARANDARVVVDYVSTDGSRGSRMYRGGMATGESGCLPCRDLVEVTGGSYTSLDMAEAALARIDQRTRSFYLLGYVPADSRFDGTYRHVRVEVNRPGVTVNYRHGYFASEDTPPLEIKAMVASSRAETLSTFDENVTDVSLNVEATVEKSASSAGQQVRVDVTVDISPLGIGLADGLHSGQLEVTVYCGDDKQKVIGETKVGWNLRANDETFADWIKNGLRRTLRVPVTAKPKFVKVIVYDPISDRTGSMTATIK
jgi:hypothetical protein